MRAEPGVKEPMMLVAQLPEAQGQVQERGCAVAEAQKPGVAAAVEAAQTQAQCDAVKVT